MPQTIPGRNEDLGFDLAVVFAVVTRNNECRSADRVLTDKSVYRDQTLADRIDREEKTFERDGAEQGWTIRSNKAWGGDFVAGQRQPRFGDRPDSLLSARDDDALRAGGFQLKPFRQRSRHHAKRSASVHKKLDFFNAPRWTGQTALYAEQSHIKSLQKNRVIVARAINNATLLPNPRSVRSRIHAEYGTTMSGWLRSNQNGIRIIFFA